MTTLHDQIMSLECDDPELSEDMRVLIFKAGYKRARHAAAELAIASDARIEALEAEGLEQSRIIGMGAERELALMARVSELEAKIERLERGEFICAKCGLRQDSTNEHDHNF